MYLRAAGAVRQLPGLGALPATAARAGDVLLAPRVVRANGKLFLLVPPIRRLRGKTGVGGYSRGLGDCSSPISSFGGVPYCRDNVSGSLIPCSDPSCGGGAGAAPVSNTPTFLLSAPPTYSTQQFGSSTTTTYTLASYMAEQLQFYTGQSPLSLANQGITPQTMAAKLMELAQQFCAAEGPSDCGQINQIVAAAVAAAQAAFQNVPASQWNPATFTAYAAGGSGVIGGGGGAGASTAARGGGPPAVVPSSASFSNVSRPGQPFQVGDSWQLVITGTPNQPVSGSATQNGTSQGTSAFGSTDQSGQLVLSGVFAPGTVGTWRELWTVGTSPAAVLSFTVAAAAAGAASKGGFTAGAGAGAGAGYGETDFAHDACPTAILQNSTSMA